MPYLEVALTGRAVSIGDARVGGQDTQSVNFSGGALSMGGGLAVHLTRRLALDFSLKRTSGEFTEVGVGSLAVGGLDIDAVSTRLNVGLVWWR